MEQESSSRVSGGLSRQVFNATLATSKRQERDLSSQKLNETKANLIGAEITEITTNSRMFGKLNSNKRSGVQINMEAPAPRSPKAKI